MFIDVLFSVCCVNGFTIFFDGSIPCDTFHLWKIIILRFVDFNFCEARRRLFETYSFGGEIEIFKVIHIGVIHRKRPGIQGV